MPKKIFRVRVFVELDTDDRQPTVKDAEEVVKTALQVLYDMGHEGEPTLCDFRVDTPEDAETPVV